MLLFSGQVIFCFLQKKSQTGIVLFYRKSQRDALRLQQMQLMAGEEECLAPADTLPYFTPPEKCPHFRTIHAPPTENDYAYVVDFPPPPSPRTLKRAAKDGKIINKQNKPSRVKGCLKKGKNISAHGDTADRGHIELNDVDYGDRRNSS